MSATRGLRSVAASAAGGSAGKSPPIPRSGAHGRRHLEIRVGVDQPRLLSRFEDGPQPVATGSHDPCPIALEDIGVGAVLEHGANQRQPPRSGHPSLKVGQFGDQRGERIIGGGRRIGAVGHGGHHGGGQTGLVRPAPIEGLAARVRLFGHRRQGQRVVASLGEVPAGHSQNPLIDGLVTDTPDPFRQRPAGEITLHTCTVSD